MTWTKSFRQQHLCTDPNTFFSATFQAFSKFTGNSQGEPWGSDTSLLRHSGTTTSLSHILFPFPLSLSRPHISTGNTESAVDHFDCEHQQLNLDRLRHWQRHLLICDGRKSASDDWISAPHARLVTVKRTLFYRTFHETESTSSCDLYYRCCMNCQFFVVLFTGHIKALKLRWWEMKTCHLFTWYRSGQVQLWLWTAGASTDHPCSPAISRASKHHHPQLPAQLCHHRRQQLHACWPEPLDRSRGSVTLWTHRADTHTTHSQGTGIVGGKTTLTQCLVKQFKSPDHCFFASVSVRSQSCYGLGHHWL